MEIEGWRTHCIRLFSLVAAGVVAVADSKRAGHRDRCLRFRRESPQVEVIIPAQIGFLRKSFLIRRLILD